MLFRVLYRSCALIDIHDRQNLDILRAAIARNSETGLTGILLRDPWHFYQYLEGPSHSVDTVLASIQRDQRHFSLEFLMLQNCDFRLFSDWAMCLEISHKKTMTEPIAPSWNKEGRRRQAQQILNTLLWRADEKREMNFAVREHFTSATEDRPI